MTAPTGYDRAREVPAASALTYLNTGSAGPLLASVEAAMREALAEELVDGRAGNTAWTQFLASRWSVRTELGALVGAHADEVALTHHTTEGLNIALWGLPWQPGDRLLITSLEHDAGLAAAATLARRQDLRVDVIDCGDGHRGHVLGALQEALREPARALLTSHVAYSTGAVLPLKEMVAAAHAEGVAVIADGAQAVGAIDVDVADLDADCYAFNGYKWLCGPEGTGVLIVRRAWHELLRPTFGGAFGVEAASVDAQNLAAMQPGPGASRYESGSTFRPHLAGLLAAIRWHRAHASSAHIAAVLDYAATSLMALGAQLHTPVGQRGGLLAFSIDGLDSAAAVTELEAAGVILRRIPATDHLRISCASFVTTEDIDRLVEALARIARPASLAQ
jgi:L-cysteine/cystine lyase